MQDSRYGYKIEWDGRLTVGDFTVPVGCVLPDMSGVYQGYRWIGDTDECEALILPIEEAKRLLSTEEFWKSLSVVEEFHEEDSLIDWCYDKMQSSGNNLRQREFFDAWREEALKHLHEVQEELLWCYESIWRNQQDKRDWFKEFQ